MPVFYVFTFVHCTAFYYPATEALINNNNNNRRVSLIAGRHDGYSLDSSLRTHSSCTRAQRESFLQCHEQQGETVSQTGITPINTDLSRCVGQLLSIRASCLGRPSVRGHNSCTLCFYSPICSLLLIILSIVFIAMSPSQQNEMYVNSRPHTIHPDFFFFLLRCGDTVARYHLIT